eukprot:7393607-Pyramimonas_sp.AAC.1
MNAGYPDHYFAVPTRLSTRLSGRPKTKKVPARIRNTLSLDKSHNGGKADTSESAILAQEGPHLGTAEGEETRPSGCLETRPRRAGTERNRHIQSAPLFTQILPHLYIVAVYICWKPALSPSAFLSYPPRTCVTRRETPPDLYGRDTNFVRDFPLQPVFHYGLVPLIIFLGMRTEPRPSIGELLRPM